MYALFTLLAGACQSAMGSLNRMLTDYVGMFGMSLVVHAVGGILLILYMKLFVHEKLKISGMPWYLYSAGFFGIFLVVTSSYCIGVLGVSVRFWREQESPTSLFSWLTALQENMQVDRQR